MELEFNTARETDSIFIPNLKTSQHYFHLQLQTTRVYMTGSPRTPIRKRSTRGYKITLHLNGWESHCPLDDLMTNFSLILKSLWPLADNSPKLIICLWKLTQRPVAAGPKYGPWICSIITIIQDAFRNPEPQDPPLKLNLHLNKTPGGSLHIKVWGTLSPSVWALSPKGTLMLESCLAAKGLDYWMYLAIFLIEINFSFWAPTMPGIYNAFHFSAFRKTFHLEICCNTAGFALGSQVAVSETKICCKLITIYGSEKLSGNICSKVKMNLVDT